MMHLSHPFCISKSSFLRVEDNQNTNRFTPIRFTCEGIERMATRADGDASGWRRERVATRADGDASEWRRERMATRADGDASEWRRE